MTKPSDRFTIHYETLRRKRKQFLALPPGEVVTLAEEDIRDNWERHQEEFLRRNIV